MEIQQFITEHPDYTERFKSYGLHLKKQKGLLLVKYPHQRAMEPGDPPWLRYCRGVLLDTTTNRVISVPPMKACEIQYGDTVGQPDVSLEYQELIDGTMINLCYYQGEWLLTTRGSIGGHNKWQSHSGPSISFKDMFQECHVDVDSLDPHYSYSFVMRHLNNRIVSPVTLNEAYLVEMYHLSHDPSGNPCVKWVPRDEYPRTDGVLISSSTTDMDAFMEVYDKPLPYHCKGFTVKTPQGRYKYLNPHYMYVKDLQPNTNSPYLNYLELRQNGNLTPYLRYYPEDAPLFTEYRDTIHRLSNDLYTTYKNVHIYKTQDKQEIPYHLKPLIYDIHGLYLKDTQPTTWDDIKQYIYSLPPKKLLFAINHIPESS